MNQSLFYIKAPSKEKMFSSQENRELRDKKRCRNEEGKLKKKFKKIYMYKREQQ